MRRSNSQVYCSSRSTHHSKIKLGHSQGLSGRLWIFSRLYHQDICPSTRRISSSDFCRGRLDDTCRTRCCRHDDMGGLVSSLFAAMHHADQSSSPELEVRAWKIKSYYTRRDMPNGMSSLISVNAIKCQLARGVCSTSTPRVWLTTSLDRVSNSFSLLF